MSVLHNEKSLNLGSNYLSLKTDTASNQSYDVRKVIQCLQLDSLSLKYMFKLTDL